MAKGQNGNTKIQIEATLSADGVAAGAQQAGDAVDTMADRIVGASTTAGKSVNSIGAGAATSADNLTRAERSMVQSIQRATAAFSAGSKSSSEYYNELAKQRGIDPAILKPYLDSLDAVAPKQKAVAEVVAATVPVMQRYEMSAKATAAALRQVPAQMTDIVVGLQGSQAPLTVLLQQGGQLKDVFGGVVPAVRAIGGYILGLLNPITLAAAAAAGIGYAFYSGRQEAENLNKAIILSGNYAGVSAGQLQVMSASVSEMAGATKGAAAEALGAFISSGQVGSEGLNEFAATALRMSKDTGVAIGDVVKSFIDLEKSPVDASLKLNESMNYLTATTYKQIKALEEQGRMLDAGALAQKAYADAQNTTMTALEANLGTVERAFRGLTSTAKSAWGAILNIGRPDTPETQVAGVQAKMANLRRILDDKRNTQGARNTAAQELAALQATLPVLQQTVAATQAKNDATAESAKRVKLLADFDKEHDKFLDKSTQKERELAAIKNKYANSIGSGSDQITQKRYNELIAGVNQKYADPQSGALAKATADFAADKVKQSYNAQADAYANGEKILESLRAAGLVSNEQYYASKRAFLQAESDAQDAALTAEIEVEKKRTATGTTKSDRAVQQIEINKKILDLESARAKARADAAANSVILGQQEAAAGSKIVNVYEEQRKAAQAYLDTVAQGNDRNLAAQGRGTARNSAVSARAQISDKYQADAQSATNAFEKGKQGPQETDAYNKQLALIDQFRTKALAQWDDYHAKVLAGEHDWTKGASRALENYADTAANVAKSTENLFMNGLKGMEDAIVSFAQTGELSFGKMADAIVNDLIRIMVQKQITGPLAAAASGGGGIGSIVSSIFGGAYATGGSPPVGIPSLVGEKGPELFVPKTAGTIIPNNMLGGGGGAMTVNIIESPGQGGTSNTRSDGDTKVLDVFVEKIKSSIAGDIANGSGAVTTALSSTYGLNRVAGAY